jgi:hypothetical protein
MKKGTAIKRLLAGGLLAGAWAVCAHANDAADVPSLSPCKTGDLSRLGPLSKFSAQVNAWRHAPEDQKPKTVTLATVAHAFAPGQSFGKNFDAKYPGYLQAMLEKTFEIPIRLVNLTLPDRDIKDLGITLEQFITRNEPHLVFYQPSPQPAPDVSAADAGTGLRSALGHASSLTDMVVLEPLPAHIDTPIDKDWLVYIQSSALANGGLFRLNALLQEFRYKQYIPASELTEGKDMSQKAVRCAAGILAAKTVKDRLRPVTSRYAGPR